MRKLDSMSAPKVRARATVAVDGATGLRATATTASCSCAAATSSASSAARSKALVWWSSTFMRSR